ncbi:hypothetical protein G9A89_014052 [Geosiphon pyriformis]|nr:hypothetical protein G9A89_014052 [Geosiphon pyriformis]
MGITAHNIWDFIVLVDGRTCIIDRHLVTYARAKCAVVCFDFAESLDAIVGTTPVLRSTNLRWSCLVSAKCAKCKKSGHTSLGCEAKVASESSFHPLSEQNVSVKSGSSLKMESSLLVSMEVNDRFATLKRSLASLVEQVGKLAKRLDALGPIVSQPSPRCQPLVTPSSQNQGADIVISESSGAATSGEIVVGAVSFDVSVMSKLEDSMKCLMETVLGLLAKVNSFGAESKLREKIRPWIVNKFDGVRVFTSDLESGYLGAGVVVVMNSSLARHVYKISEVPGQLLSIKLLFRNKLLVSILGLYVGASLAVRFSQTGEVNSLIAKAVNEFSFVVLGGNFNKDGSHKCASFKKCLDLDLVNSLTGSPALKLPTWANSKGVMKTIDYVFVSLNLIDVIVNHEILDVSEHFNTDHQAVSMAGADEIKWNSFKDAISINATLFSDKFDVSVRLSDLDAM